MNDVEAYKVGLSAFQDEDWPTAVESFSLRRSLRTPSSFTTGGSPIFAARTFLAFAAWRKALTLDPFFSSAREGIEFLLKSQPLRLRAAPEPLGNLSKSALGSHSGFPVCSPSCFALMGSGHLLIRYFSQRKTALYEELPMPAFPWAGSAHAPTIFVSTGPFWSESERPISA